MTLTEIIARLEELEKESRTAKSALVRADAFEAMRDLLEEHARTLVAAGKVAEAAKGLSFGEDWNNGTHAKMYRAKLLAALAELDETIKENK